MLKEHIKVFRKILWLVDLGLIALSFFLAYMINSRILGFVALTEFANFLPILIIIWGALLHYFGMYESIRTMRIPKILMTVVRITLYAFIVFVSILYLVKVPPLGRSFMALSFGLSAILICMQRIILIYFFRYMRAQGYNYRSILVVGTGRKAQQFAKVAEEHKEWGLKISGFLVEDKDRVGKEIYGYPVLGAFDDLSEITDRNIIDEVMFLVPYSRLSRIEPLVQFCENKGLRMHLSVDYFELKLARVKQTELNGFPILTFETTPDQVWHLLLKRVIDLVVSALALIILLPVFLVITICIKLTSAGPVFFRQVRCGLNRRSFVLYKFRTMIDGAEQMIESLSDYNEMQGPVFKMHNDPRMTSIGRFLRKNSLDELPQLYNVIKGEMSLVGPRPPIMKEVQDYRLWQKRRLSMRPGITCLWQANGRNHIRDFEKWTKLDLDYIDNWSLWLDVKILFKTIPAVLFGSGAK